MQEEQPAAGLPRKILVVEDDKTFQWLLRRELTENGFHVDCCSDSTTAAALSHGRIFDIYILDCGVFRGKAAQFIRSLRQRHSNGLIIGISAYYDGADIVESGADYFLDKPFEFKDLLGMIYSN